MIDEMLTTLLGFPTVIWTTLMLAILGYWSLVMVGALGIDIFPGDAEAEIDAQVEGGGVLSGLSHALSLGQVPLTVVISLLVFKSWLISIAAQLFIMPLLISGILVGLIGTTIFLGSFVGALWLTTYTARPLKPLFRVHTVRGAGNLIGGQVIITSSRVSETFGTAIFKVPDHHGQELLLNVVCDIPNDMAMDSAAVITNYDPQCGSYTVRPLAQVGMVSTRSESLPQES
ncbi:MAG: hypothetical protein EA402_12040 [Planctomycetota bacterium]|nr:MAG: hypothetical protein EA402_12040 [Planctomycetota bacterium]